MPEAVVEVNGRAYRVPDEPTAVVCIDGSDPSYLDDALERGLMPALAESLERGATYALGRSQLPSFTNPNNVSIVTGLPPAGHGIPGNHYLAPSGEEVQLTDPTHLRAPTIHAAFAAAGVPVACVTTKDKLRRLLSSGGVPCLSAEEADRLPVPNLGLGSASELLGRPSPGIYDPACSIYALGVGLEVARRLGACLVYVSLTDYVQHLEPPGGALADAFYAALDAQYAAYLEEGFRVALVADHGMRAKVTSDGQPNVRYLEDALEAAGIYDSRVVLPITDPYVVHHAALGSAAWIHLDRRQLSRAADVIRALDGIEQVIPRERAAVELELPADRIGDLVVLADGDTALGRSKAFHDLAALRGPLRSHGGRHEQTVPIVVSRPLAPAYAERLAAGVTNADIHELVLNGIA